MTKRHVAAVILAAGSSTRFGSPKQLLEWEGRPLIITAVDIAWAAGLNPIIVVLGASVERIEPVLASRPVQILRNYHWAEGISSSIRTGVSALLASVDAVIFIPSDQPLLTSAFLQDIVKAYEQTDKAIVIPHAPDGQRGGPVLFDRKLFPELSHLSGDEGGRKLFFKYPDRIAKLPAPNAFMLMDIDTPEAYSALQARRKQIPGLNLARIRGIICDMDGVLWRGQEPLAGFHDFFDFVHVNSLGYVLVTNNSSRTPVQYAQKLLQMGAVVKEHHILNSAIAVAYWISTQSPVATVYPIGGPGVLEALFHYGLDIRGEDAEQVDYVVVGWDQSLTWKKLAAATRLILNGAKFIGTNPDLTFPMEASLAPGNGAQLAALETATSVKPLVIGKPENLLYQQAMDMMGTIPATTLVIGDRLDTDILGGVRLGIPTALVLTGVSNRDTLAQSPIQPSAVFEDLPQLLDMWRDQLIRSEKV
jgi:4-nitrophenyl phosphatase